MKYDQLPRFSRGSQAGLQPNALNGSARVTVGFVAVTVDNKEVHRSPHKIVVALIIGQGEVI